MDRKRDDLDNLKAELGWSMVKKVQSEVLKVQENIEKSATKIDMYQQKIAKDAERRKELMQEKVSYLPYPKNVLLWPRINTFRLRLSFSNQRNIERQIQNVATDTAKLQAELEEVNGELKNVRLTEKNAAKTSSELERKMKAKRTEVKSDQWYFSNLYDDKSYK